MEKVKIISEIGINHNGSLDIAKELIRQSKEAGCDYVKFQKRTPSVCVPEAQKSVMRSTPWGEMTYLEYKERIEFGLDEYREIDRYCKEIGIQWSASPWDTGSLRFLKDNFDLPWIKIPSALVTNLPFVRECATDYEHVIISTGMTTEEDIRNAVTAIKKVAFDKDSLCEVVIMHCNSQYPTPVKDLNLSYIKQLVSNYVYDDIGYSGHEEGVATSIASVYLGATWIERHFTLNKSMWGTDHKSSLTFSEMKSLVEGIHELQVAYGNGIKTITDGEQAVMAKLRNTNQ